MSDEIEVSEDVSRLLREVMRQNNGYLPSSLALQRRPVGRWSARFGNKEIVSADPFRGGDWLLFEYHPPKKPISETVIEAGP